MNPEYKRAALIATAITVPFVVIAGLAIGALTGAGGSGHAGHTPTPSSGSGLAGVTVAPPPSPDAATEAACTKVLANLPITLDYGGTTLAGRPALSTSTYVAAWGDPAIVLRCGVARPSALTPGSSSQIFQVGAAGVWWLPVKTSSTTVFTTIDRAVYIEASVPRAYSTPPLAQITAAISEALPSVCSTDPNETDTAKLCTHRP